MSDVAADALVVKGEILVEYAKPYGLNRNPNVNLASLGTRSELASLALSFRGHNFVQNTRATTYDCAHVRTRMRIFILAFKPHPQSILRGVVC